MAQTRTKLLLRMRETATVTGHYASALNEVLLIAAYVADGLALVPSRRKDFHADAPSASAQGSDEADPVATGCGRGRGRGPVGGDFRLGSGGGPRPRRLNSSRTSRRPVRARRGR